MRVSLYPRTPPFLLPLPGSNQVRSSYEGLRKSRLDGFMDGFNAISLKLKEMYQMITLGGDAELELVDTLDPFSEVMRGGRAGGCGDQKPQEKHGGYSRDWGGFVRWRRCDSGAGALSLGC